jgi:adenine-specific DNA-methyltransferase
MQAQFNNIYVANPLNILQELDPNQFDLVYLDPPYFTRSPLFDKNNTQSLSQSFEEYLEYVVGIISQSHRLLKESGSILLRMDPLSLFNARLFLDRIFGKQHFRAEVIWKRRVSNFFKGCAGYLTHPSVFLGFRQVFR